MSVVAHTEVAECRQFPEVGARAGSLNKAEDNNKPAGQGKDGQRTEAAEELLESQTAAELGR